MTSYIKIKHIFVNLMKPVNHSSIYVGKCRKSVNSDKQCQNNKKKYNIFQNSHEPNRYKLYFIVFLDLENMGLDTLFVHLRQLVFKLRTQIRSPIIDWWKSEQNIDPE